MSILDILKQYTDSSAPVPANASEHFDTVAQQAAPSDLGGGIAAALRSNATPSFGQTVGTLFGRSDPQQQAGVLNQLIQAIGPAAAAVAGSGVLQRVLGTSGTSAPISPAQASQVSPAEVSAIAAHAEQHNGSVVDQLSNFYAQHPTLVKTLGAAALGVVMSHMSQKR